MADIITLLLDECCIKWECFVLSIWHFIKPPPPFLSWYHQDYNPLQTSIPIPQAPPTMCHVYLVWVGGYLLHEPPMEINGAKSHLPFVPPLFPPISPSSSARQIDDSHLFFPSDSRVFAVPLIHPRDRPCNSVIHQQDLSLFALLCYRRNKSVCLLVEYT